MILKWLVLIYCVLVYATCGANVHVCGIIEEYISMSGPTFIKTAQLLAQRYDLLPKKICLALQKVFDRVEPDSSLYARAIECAKQIFPDATEEELNEIELVGSASLSQVYRFQGYAIKIRRPHIKKIVDEDFQIILLLLYFVMSWTSIYYDDVVSIVKHIRKTIIEQCNFKREVASLQLFQKFNTLNISTPKVYPEFSTNEWIVMDYMDGIPLYQCQRSHVEELLFNVPNIAEQLCEFVTRPFVFDCKFHADLHPGNVLVCDDGLNIIDFGWICDVPPDILEVIEKFVTQLKSSNFPETVKLIEEKKIIVSSKKPISQRDREYVVSLVKSNMNSNSPASTQEMIHELLHYFMQHHIRLDTRYMHLLIARFNGHQLFELMQQDLPQVMRQFFMMMLVYRLQKAGQEFFSSFTSESAKEETSNEPAKDEIPNEPEGESEEGQEK